MKRKEFFLMKKQVYNPFLPIYECVPDGEPHVFGDRVYLYGSHDKEGGETFCMLDYTTYSAPVTDLSDWRCEGTIYRADQDPAYPTDRKFMYAPDVVPLLLYVRQSRLRRLQRTDQRGCQRFSGRTIPVSGLCALS